jgi:ubiquinone/menaquinone biosynthesis C-methylase UbiE
MGQKEHIIKTYQKKEIVDIFDKERYMFKYQKEKHKLESKIVIRAISKEEKIKILDVACGTGRLVPTIFKKNNNAEYFGLDTSKEMLAWLQEKVKKLNIQNKVKLVISDATKIPFKDETFDIVFTYHLLWHLPFEEQEKIIREMLRVTKRGGILIIDILNKEFFWEKIKNFFGIKSKEIYKDSIKDIKKILEENGIIRIDKLSDAIIKANFLYWPFSIINKANKILPNFCYHMLYLTVKKIK